LESVGDAVSAGDSEHRTIPLGVEISNWSPWEQRHRLGFVEAAVPIGARGEEPRAAAWILIILLGSSWSKRQPRCSSVAPRTPWCLSRPNRRSAAKLSQQRVRFGQIILAAPDIDAAFPAKWSVTAIAAGGKAVAFVRNAVSIIEIRSPKVAAGVKKNWATLRPISDSGGIRCFQSEGVAVHFLGCVGVIL